jgi:hypothetical protein
VPGGVEVRTKGSPYQLMNLPALREVAGVELSTDGDEHVALIRLNGQCNVQQARAGNKFRVDLIDAGPMTAAPQAPSQAAPSQAAPSQAAGSQSAAAQTPPAPAKITPPSKTASDLEGLRAGLTEKLALLKATAAPPAKPASGAAPTLVLPAQQFVPPTILSGAPAPDAVAAARPSCPPSFSMDGWQGDGPFPKALQALRLKAAEANESASALAALAEFYLGNGLGGEALAVTQEIRLDAATADERLRVQRDADIARLFNDQPIQSTSVLLANAGDCNRADVPLWRVLSAAASNDTEVMRRDAEGAGRVLMVMPEPIASQLALQIAEADTDDLPVLRAMAGAIRNAETGTAVEMAGRFLLQARIAHAEKDPIDEANFLGRALQGTGLTGLKAKVLLAQLHATDDDDKVAAQSEPLLADTARVYRDTPLGRGASAALSELRLRHGDYLGALRAANITSAGRNPENADSRGASLAARVLRNLLVEKNAPSLPPASERLLIYWRYSGYATPGEKGDDIRLGAADLMLDQGMPEAALDALHQLSASVSQSPRAQLLRATAEARAGDADLALNLLKNIPADDASRRATADALERQGKPVDAAHQLDANKDAADRMRRAGLLYTAKQWGDAADAYADVLRASDADKDTHDEAADRYAVALALAGRAPADGVGDLPGLAKHVIGALPSHDTQAQAEPVSAIRGSIKRASEIEALLPAPPAPPAPAGGG